MYMVSLNPLNNLRMKRLLLLVPVVLILLVMAFKPFETNTQQWIRINQLGYTPQGMKVAVWCSKENDVPEKAELVDEATGKTVMIIPSLKSYGVYGPFTQTTRINFSKHQQPGRYFLRAGKALSPVFTIGKDVYKGSADFCLRYMRQQRSGFNPYLKDSCHRHDGYTLYGPMPDSTFMPVTGGWHDASDYLQYVTTTANATWHLLSAYQEYGEVFGDEHQASGLDGKNKVADVLDEAYWGLQWLMKMNPSDSIMFNQLGDDRDHVKMRIPAEDTNYYGRGFERPVYFVSGKPQVRGKFMNATTGAASTAGKYASTFAKAAVIYQKQPALSTTFAKKSVAAYHYGQRMPGVAQTASVKSPYIYAEGNWVDDMELAAAGMIEMKRGDQQKLLQEAFQYARKEPITPWLGKDTAHHYEWYPFINLGHKQLAGLEQLPAVQQDSLLSFYQQGIEAVWNKAKQNAFYRGVPFIWCSNNLTVSFAIQCIWYRQLTGDDSFTELEQANIDWLFGCNPWGTSMVYGLPSWGDTPVDPHSAFTHLKKYPIDGGLVDGPVYTNIYNGLIGIQLNEPDEYAAFQSKLAVYHDDYGDYSTNEPTMDGTASLIYLLASREWESAREKKRTAFHEQWIQGALVRKDSTVKKIYLVFTGDEFGEGLQTIYNSLEKHRVKGSFYLTGRFYRNKTYQPLLRKLQQQGHYLGAHSDAHLLYNDWNDRKKTLVTRDSAISDYRRNLAAMKAAGLSISKQPSFIPPYEWWNSEVAQWFRTEKVSLVSFTPGTGTNADYTWPEMGAAFRSTEKILQNLYAYETARGLNGTILLIHAGTDPRRKDKLYDQLDTLISTLTQKGYSFHPIP
jgi:peptidoglycan/xylan/chitin deacetylase (PgdA/CDA1 family)